MENEELRNMWVKSFSMALDMSLEADWGDNP